MAVTVPCKIPVNLTTGSYEAACSSSSVPPLYFTPLLSCFAYSCFIFLNGIHHQTALDICFLLIPPIRI